MKLSLSAKCFFWLAGTVAVFCALQVLGMLWMEVGEVVRGEEPLSAELGEIVVLCSVSVCVFVLMLGLFWFVSRKMIEPIHRIAEGAHRISEGDLTERVEGEGSSDEIGTLASTLNRAFDGYQEVLRRLDGFAGNAAHQLRTPLSSIRSMGEVCLQRERNAVEYRECISEMLEATRELTSIVEKLLMIARMNPSRVRQHFTRVVLGEVLSEVLAVYDAIIEEKNITLESGDIPDTTVIGDRNLIGQAIGNVVENTVQFTPKGGTVTVTLQKQDDRIVLQVSDTGPGMPESMCLHGSDDGSATWDGELPTGRIGLAIVSEIMRIHEGTVQFRRREDGGTCVELGWPYSGKRDSAET